jgi:cell division protein FtsL
LNAITKYEEIIAQKLDAITVPDMADAIWANITLGLDADIENNTEQNNKNQPSNTKPFPKHKILLIGGAVSIAVVAVFFYFKNKKRTTNKQITPIQQNINIPTKDKDTNTENINYPLSPNVLKNTNVDKTSTTKPQDIKNNIDFQDSSITPPNIFTPLVQDSITNVPNKIPNKITTDTSVPITPSIKKSRGVKGITDADYKIRADKKKD